MQTLSQKLITDHQWFVHIGAVIVGNLGNNIFKYKNYAYIFVAKIILSI